MTIADLISAIASVGFPIVACGALFWFATKVLQQIRDEVANLRDTINNNTAIMNKVLDKIEELK